MDGSYTITFDDGHKYHGKGPISRMAESALIHSTEDNPVTNLDWTAAATSRQAFKDEHTRMQTDKVDRVYPQGVENPINYNIRQSPGYEYKKQDGQSTDY